MNKARAEVKIRGRVQGVYFRQSTKETADRLGLTGWVRNCPDGAVAALFEGERTTIEEMLAWCQIGPRAASVSAVEVDWQNVQGDYSAFTILR